jgi:hypothetical protein
MAKSKQLTLEEVAKRREDLEKALATVLTQEAELATKELHDHLENAIASLANLPAGQRYTKEVKAFVRKLNKTIIGNKVDKTSDSSKPSKEEKKSCVEDFLKSQSGEFTMTDLRDFAAKRNITVPASPEQYFQTSLKGNATKVKVRGKVKTVEGSRTQVWQAVSANG